MSEFEFRHFGGKNHDIQLTSNYTRHLLRPRIEKTLEVNQESFWKKQQMDIKKSTGFLRRHDRLNGMQFPLTQSLTEEEHKHCACEQA